jgi:hypothetical protein
MTGKEHCIDVDFICEELEILFATPCNFSPIDEEMAVRYDGSWCEGNCSPENYAKCWKLYFEMIFEGQRG